MSDVNVPVGYKNTEVGVTPEDWKVTTIGDFAPLQRGFDLPTTQVEAGEYPVVYSNGILRSHKIFQVNGAGIVTGRSGTIGKVHYVERDFWPHNTTLWVTSFSGSDVKFVYYLFNSIGFERFKSGSGVPTLNRNDAHIFKIAVPSNVKEQTAIATALSDVDNLLQSLERLISKKEAIKTATMQQLLTGKTRLPEFATREDGSQKGVKQTDLGQIPEDWEVDEVHNLLKITTGNKNTQDKIETGKYPFFVRSQTIERINTYSFDGEGVLTAGDGVGTGKVYHYINGKFDYHQRVYLMHDFGDKLNGYYFYLYFSTNFYDRIMSMNAKSSVDSVRRDMIANMKILFPSKEEQTAIATILSDMDAEIQALHARLTKTQDIKQGMMQQLLTGKIRLPH